MDEMENSVSGLRALQLEITRGVLSRAGRLTAGEFAQQLTKESHGDHYNLHGALYEKLYVKAAAL
jgi:hypothetical protein